MFDSPNLQPYACAAAASRGRRFKEIPAPTRTDFQRDRDRIVHSTAFRRLEYKTQVFINHEGDLFRTRLTHSIEVAQLARSAARALGLNEDLVETIGLAHDMGHTPFGHAGQDALNEMMADYGGFEHNWQSLRVVDYLEDRYPNYPGLNLTFEVREGILKHCSRRNALVLEQQQPNGVAYRFLHPTSPSLEAQLTDLADGIAYNSHDVDDGLRSGLITIEQLQQNSLFANSLEQSLRDNPKLPTQYWSYAALRCLLSNMVYDLIDQTSHNLQQVKPKSIAEVRDQTGYLVGFSPTMSSEISQLKQFLMRNLYRHPQVNDKMEQAQQVLRELFSIYLGDYAQMSADYVAKAQRQLEAADEPAFYRTIADYIAGMTDRFALNEYYRLTGRELTASFYQRSR